MASDGRCHRGMSGDEGSQPAGEDEPIVQSTFYTMDSFIIILNLELYTFPDVFHNFTRSAP